MRIRPLLFTHTGTTRFCASADPVNQNAARRNTPTNTTKRLIDDLLIEWSVARQVHTRTYESGQPSQFVSENLCRVVPTSFLEGSGLGIEATCLVANRCARTARALFRRPRASSGRRIDAGVARLARGQAQPLLSECGLRRQNVSENRGRPGGRLLTLGRWQADFARSVPDDSLSPSRTAPDPAGWPLPDLRKPIRGALPELDDGLVAVVAHWLAAKRAIVPALVDLPVLPWPSEGPLHRADSVPERQP